MFLPHQRFSGGAVCSLTQSEEPLLFEPRHIAKEEKLAASDHQANGVLLTPSSLPVLKHVLGNNRNLCSLIPQVERSFHDGVALGVKDLDGEFKVVDEFQSTMEPVATVVSAHVVLERCRELKLVFVGWRLGGNRERERERERERGGTESEASSGLWS